MNDNSNETPNPLSPGVDETSGTGDGMLDANPAEPFNQPMRPRARTRAPGARPATARSVDPMMSGSRTMSGASVASNMPEFANKGNTEVPPSPVDPLEHQVEQMQMPANAEPPKKKKAGLIIGIIVCLALIIGGVAAALVYLNMNKGDAVTMAMARVLNGESPENVSVTGSFELKSDDGSSPLSSMKIDLNSDINSNSLANSSSATLTVGFIDGQNISLEPEAIYTESGDLYFKIDGVVDALQNYTNAINVDMAPPQTTEETDKCVDDDYISTECSPSEQPTVDCIAGTDCTLPTTTVSGGNSTIATALQGFGSILETIDGTFIKISVSELSQLFNGMGNNTNQLECVKGVAKEFRDDRNVISDIYKNNTFISSTTEGVSLSSTTGNPVYKVTIDQQKAKAFGEEFQKTKFVKNLSTCFGGTGEEGGDNNSSSSPNNKLPSVYAEVDKDYNFTRIYMEGEYESFAPEYTDVDGYSIDGTEPYGYTQVEYKSSGKFSYKVDFKFAYPSTLNIVEPDEYMTVNDLQQQLMNGVLQNQDSEEVETESVEQ